MANEKIHEYVDAADAYALATQKSYLDADTQIGGVWTSVKVNPYALANLIVHGIDTTGQENGLKLLTMTSNEILAIPNPVIGAVVFNLDHDTICFYASNGWQRLNHQPM